MVPMTKPLNAKQIPELQTRTPRAIIAPPTVSPATVGHRNCSRRLAIVDLRHASSGPTPVSSSSTSPIGTIHLLKNGGPTVMRCPGPPVYHPVTASLSVGNIVAKMTKNAQNSRIQLFSRNAASREAHESNSL